MSYKEGWAYNRYESRNSELKQQMERGKCSSFDHFPFSKVRFKIWFRIDADVVVPVNNSWGLSEGGRFTEIKRMSVSMCDLNSREMKVRCSCVWSTVISYILIWVHLKSSDLSFCQININKMSLSYLFIIFIVLTFSLLNVYILYIFKPAK